MAKPKHTPAPWKVAKWEDESLADGFATVITDSRGHGLVEFLQFGENEKVKANAELIANAPNNEGMSGEGSGIGQGTGREIRNP